MSMSMVSSSQPEERLDGEWTPNANASSEARARMREVRSQAAVVRALLDELDRAAAGDSLVGEQIIEELARLGCRIWEAASEMTSAMPAPESGTRLRLAQS